MLFPLALRENKITTAHAQTFFQSIHMRFSLSPRGNSTKFAHRYLFSPLSAFFSCTTSGSRNFRTIVHILTVWSSPQVFLRHQHTTWFLQLLNRLHAFVSRWVHCFLHVLKSAVVVLLTCHLEKCLERGKLRMSSCICLHKWLEKSLYNLSRRLPKNLFPVHN